MIKRKGSHAFDCWSVPGGWLEYGETPAQGAMRELAEELDFGTDLSQLTKVIPKSFGFESEIFPEVGMQSVSLYLHFGDVGCISLPKIKDKDKIAEVAFFDLLRPDTFPNVLFPGLHKVIARLQHEHIHGY